MPSINRSLPVIGALLALSLQAVCPAWAQLGQSEWINPDAPASGEPEQSQTLTSSGTSSQPGQSHWIKRGHRHNRRQLASSGQLGQSELITPSESETADAQQVFSGSPSGTDPQVLTGSVTQQGAVPNADPQTSVNIQSAAPDMQNGMGVMQNNMGMQNGMGMMQNNMGMQNGMGMLQNNMGMMQNGMGMMQNNMGMMQNNMGMMQNGMGMMQNNNNSQNSSNDPTSGIMNGVTNAVVAAAAVGAIGNSLGSMVGPALQGMGFDNHFHTYGPASCGTFYAGGNPYRNYTTTTGGGGGNALLNVPNTLINSVGRSVNYMAPSAGWMLMNRLMYH